MDDQNPSPATPLSAGSADDPEPLAGPSGRQPGTDARDGLADAVRELSARFAAHVEQNDLQRRAFDTLHDDLQKYKDAFLLNEFQRPVIRHLIDLYDRLIRIEETLPRIGSRKTGPTVEEFTADLGRFVGNLTGFRHALTEVLARVDVESYEDRHDVDQQQALRALDVKLHRAVAVELTDDPGLNNRVARVHKTGFYWRERVIRPQEIIVFRYQAPAPLEENDDG